MNLKRSLKFAALTGAVVAGSALAQSGGGDFPSRPMRIVIPFSAGSGVDLVGRSFAQKISEQTGQPVVAENREGAGGMVGAAYAGTLPPDGYSMLVATNPFVVAPIMQGKANYDPVKGFAAVARVAINPLALTVGPAVPANTMKELIAYARANPGKLSYASSGPGTPSQLDMEFLKTRLGMDILEVPYKSNAQALLDVVSGRVGMYYTVQSTGLAHVRSGKLRALAVGASRRTTAFPDVPTMAEAADLPGYEALVWYGFVVPAGTPPDVIARLQTVVARAAGAADLVDRVTKGGFEFSLSGTAEFAKQINAEAELWTKLAKDLGAPKN